MTNASPRLEKAASGATAPAQEHSPRERVHVDHPELSLLLPEVAPEVDSRAHTTRSTHGAAQWDARRVLTAESRVEAEPNEVHVHIGRIDVTAVHEPAGKRAKREPARPRRTLEEYLTGRTKADP